MAKLSASYCDISALDDGMQATMFALFERYYAAVNMDLFLSDLQSKTIAILLKDEDGELQGFSTVEVIKFDSASGPATALYSGDTIISHHHWGEQQLSYAWCYYAGQVKAQRPSVPLYWFLIVKGHRTYRYLPAFTRKFYPNYRETTPPELQSIIDQLAGKKFSDAYRADNGTLHFAESRGHLRPEWDELSDDITKKPHVAFFLDKNPNYAMGDELVCLTELNDRNMRFVSRTAFIEGMDSCPDGQLSDRVSLDIATD